jgi:hypothetical protein
LSADTIAKILKILKDDDVELRCAAALILGRLRPLTPPMVKGLRQGMRESPTHAKSYFLDALLHAKDPSVLPDIVALLDEKGSIADQAVGVVRKFGGPALAAIEEAHAGQDHWRNGAYIKAVAGIHQLRAVRMLVQRLPYATWEEARGTSLFIAEHFQRYPKTAQKFLEKALCKMITDPPEGLPAHCLITCLKMVHRLKFQIDPDALLHLGETNDVPSVRRHALTALEVQTPSAESIGDYRCRLYDLLSKENRDVTAPSMDVLMAWSTPRIPAKELRALTERDGASLREYALSELARRRDRMAVPILCEHLDHQWRRIRTFAARTLLTMKGGDDLLLSRFIDTPETDLRMELSEVLVSSNLKLPEASLKRMRKDLAAGFAQGKIDHAALHLLGLKDRDGLNEALVKRAKKFIKDGTPDLAISCLQPLVRFRHGKHESRFVLAMANFDAAKSHEGEDDPRYQRCIDILSPLSRIHELQLEQKIKRIKRLDSSDRIAILRGLSQKGGMERRVCRAIVDQIKEAELDEVNRADLDRIKKMIGS